jgi:hypothetical protein
MARTMKKFSAGGAQGKYERRMADIKKDFDKDSAGKSGKALEVLAAKRAQRTADAEDDRAKRTGADRTATRKAEYDAEKSLSRTRKFGADKPAAAAEPAKTAAPAAAPEAAKAKPQTFGAAFKEARSRLGAGKTFTFGGKSFTTNIAGEGRKPTGAGADTPIKQDTPKTDTPKTDFRKVRGGSNSGAPTKPLPATPFNRQAFVDLKVAAERGKPVNSQNPVLARMRAIAEAPGASRAQIQDYRRAVESGRYNMAKGGKVKKENTMKYAKGGSTPPQPTPAERARSKKQLDELKKLKPTDKEAKVIGSANRSEGPGYKKGGKMATKFGAAMKKKSADTKGRAMMKFAKGGSIDGCAVKGKTKGKMV